MRRTKEYATLLWTVLAATHLWAQEGFRPLFNGRDLSGWVNVNGAPETWTVREGMIVCSGVPKSVLRTDRMYQNFILELEWRHVQQGGNAGLFLFADGLPAVGGPYPRCIEVQIRDGNPGDIFPLRGAGMCPWSLPPEGRVRSVPSENLVRPAGQWNHYRVEARDGVVTLAVNGKVVNRAYHVIPRKGYICLEAEGSEVHFRNLRIRELPGADPPPEVVARDGEGFVSLYNGVDLRGWRVAPGSEGHWRPKDWILAYDGKSEAQGDGRHLWTEEEFGDFLLMVDWRLPGEVRMDSVPVILPDGSTLRDAAGGEVRVPIADAGDSGIYLRGSSKAQVNIWNWPVGSGEIWGYRTDPEMPACVRQGATPIQAADNAIGEWNRFVITVRGSRVWVELNGKPVICGVELPGLPARGRIGLQHHGDPIEFANLFIKRLDGVK
ncbi:MAG: DUF1080 domain-containing protein [candidate division KSB1 bacterium]|nr:DUF1080 domain-containing protein [candidate division KSB1 bacterium]